MKKLKPEKSLNRHDYAQGEWTKYCQEKIKLKM